MHLFSIIPSLHLVIRSFDSHSSSVQNHLFLHSTPFEKAKRTGEKTKKMTSQPLKVIIVGSGIGGLITAIMLDRAGIEYVILEKRKTHSVIGSAIAFTAVVLRVLEQIGLYEDIHKISKEFSRTTISMQDGKVIGVLEGEFAKERYGYYNEVACMLMFILLEMVRLCWFTIALMGVVAI